MALMITETEKRHEVVNKLSAIDVEFISLVPQGANGESFTLVKNADGGEADMAGPVIQSFVLPNTTEFDELKAQPGMEWLNEVDFSKATKQGYANFTRYTVLSKGAFQDNSFETVPVGEGWAVVGKLKEGEGSEGKEIVQKDLGAPVMMPDPYYSGDQPQVSVGDMVRRESWAFLDSVDATFRQSFADPKKRKTSIMNNLSNYWDALSALLDMAPAGIVKGVKIGERPAADQIIKNANDNNSNNPGGIEMTKDEVLAIIKEAKEAEMAAELEKKAAMTPNAGENHNDFMGRCMKGGGDMASCASSWGSNATKSADNIAAETVAALTKGITELAVAVTKLQGDVTEIKEKGVASSDTTETPEVETPVPDQSEVAALAKGLEELTKQVTGLLHSTNSPAPRTDGEPIAKASIEKSVFDGVFAKR